MINNLKLMPDNIKSIAYQSIIFYFFYMLYQAISIFQYFDKNDIVLVSIVFFILFIISVLSFYKRSDFNIEFNLRTLIASILVVYILVYLSNPSYTAFYHATTYPLLTLDIHKVISADTVFHTSLIQGIINFGYPTTGFHDTPVQIYHTLSHYVDALILKLIGLEPLDHYGLLFFFKIWILIASIVVFLTYTNFKYNYLLFIISLVVLVPVIVNKWNLIYSHGMWFTSVLIILSIYPIYQLLKKDALTKKEILFIFFIVILFGLGKLSSGFMLAVFIGFYLLFKDYRQKFVYLIGSGWVIFFYSFQKLMLIEGSATIGWNISNLQNLFSVMEINIALIAILFIFVLTYVFFKSKHTLLLLAAYFISLCIIILLIIIIDLNNADLNYFRYSFFYIAILFVVLVVSDNINYIDNEKYFLYFYILLIAFFLFFYRQVFDLNDYIIKENKSIDYNYYYRVNKKIDLNLLGKKNLFVDGKVRKKITLEKYLSNKKLFLYQFRESLYKFMNTHNLKKSNTLLFISKDTSKKEKNILSKKSAENINSLTLFAVTGVPSLNGLRDLAQYYSIPKYYDRNSLTISKDKLLKNIDTIMNNHKKNIIIVNDFKTSEFSLIKYNKGDI